MSKKKYLLVSAKPAPNGKLHLGHLSGPYLAQDMYYRKLTADGHAVKVISGTDAIDSFIHLRAVKEGVPAAQLASEHFGNIEASFAGFSIHYDCFINPFSEKWQDRYVGTMQEVVCESQNAGKAIKETYPFPFSEQGKPASGAWIIGSCPDCHSSMSGYFCEDCGAHVEPSEIQHSQHRENDEKLKFVDKEDLFFQVSNPTALYNQLQLAGVRESELAIVAKQFEQQRNRVRLTEWAQWGVPYAKAQQVYFGHGLLFAYCRLIGEAYQSLTANQLHPFNANSDVTTINFFGVDNTVSHMININAIGTEMPQWKGFDHFVVNYFYLLNGRKFSTSAGHVVNSNEVLENEYVNAEGVRFVLAATSPAIRSTDFTQSALLHYYNEILIEQVLVPLVDISKQLDGQVIAYSQSNSTFLARWDLLTEIFEFAKFDPQKVVEIILQHIASLQTCSDQVEQASCLAESALLLYIVVPDIARKIWQSCGLVDSPNVDGLLNSQLEIQEFVSPIHRITSEMITELFR